MLAKKIKRVAEYRALPVEVKGLEEKRNELIEEMEGIVSAAKGEVRTLTDDEETRCTEIENEINKIDSLIKKDETLRAFGNVETKKDDKEKETRTQEEINNEELRDIFLGKAAESRASTTAMNTGTNEQGGYVINTELSKEIIKEIKDRSDVYNFFNSTSIKGNVKIPKQKTSGVAKWEDENPADDTTPSIPTLEVVELGQNRLYRESAITQQMVNVAELDLQGFIKGDIADSMTDAIENAIFNGSGSKQPTGLVQSIKAENKFTLEERGVLTVDILKKCKASIKKSVRNKAKWFMNDNTFLQIDLLKDSMGRPLLQPNVAEGTGYKLLNLPVEVTDALPTIEDEGEKCLIVLATPEAYHTNTQKSVALYIYNDSTYTRKGLIGYGSDVYMDGKVKDEKQLAGVFNPAALRAKNQRTKRQESDEDNGKDNVNNVQDEQN